MNWTSISEMQQQAARKDTKEDWTFTSKLQGVARQFRRRSYLKLNGARKPINGMSGPHKTDFFSSF